MEAAQENNCINSKIDQPHATKGRWCLGGDEFRNEQMERIEGLLKGVGKGNISGVVVRETGEHQVEKLIVRGMMLQKTSSVELKQAKRNSPKKRTLAWRVRSRTTSIDEMDSPGLADGRSVQCIRSMGMVQNTKDKEIRRWKKQLLR